MVFPHLQANGGDDIDMSIVAEHFQCVQAAKLYYLGLRSCPVLFRQAWTAIRDKQLNNTVSIYTSRYFSELLIGAEMDRLRSMISSLDSDVFSIRIMPNVNEVKATVSLRQGHTGERCN